jgi:succinate dehydrogenase/fumarate reductase flavoprotein subunit
MRRTEVTVSGKRIPVHWVHTLVIGSGAAGLNAAVQLRTAGLRDILMLTEGLNMGTSINTGSDKQTYYKVSMFGRKPDSPHELAQELYAGGSMHGDLALVEASLSARAFINLVDLGVAFPRDRYGQFLGYQTDYDEGMRATSVGPHTSRAMCERLIRRANQLGIETREGEHAVELLVLDEGHRRRAAGTLAVGCDGLLRAYVAENVIFAVGGPAGLYQHSVYPAVQTGAIGLALMAGATANNLPESQFGLASVAFRWNVSGSYMQAMPRFVSTGADGCSDEHEVLTEYFDTPGELFSSVFAKGYQWPFDAARLIGGSSLIDLVVFIETACKGRRVFLDYRRDPAQFSFERLGPEALGYLERSNALIERPIARLRRMNPDAVELYRDQGIDLENERLEIRVCAQHNNGGLAGNLWWESANISHLFPIGEVNGSHGVHRPGGAALNSGQVGGYRAAEFIENRYEGWTLDEDAVWAQVEDRAHAIQAWLARCPSADTTWQEERLELQQRMSATGAQVRSRESLATAVHQAWRQWRDLEELGCRYDGTMGLIEALRDRHLCFAHAVYLDAIRFAVERGVGSRGSAIVLDPGGIQVHPRLAADWAIEAEDPSFRDKVLETTYEAGDGVRHEWVSSRPLPEPDGWFETGWARFRDRSIYG